MWKLNLEPRKDRWKKRYTFRMYDINPRVTKKAITNIERLFKYIRWIKDPVEKQEFMYAVINKSYHSVGGYVSDLKMPMAICPKKELSKTKTLEEWCLNAACRTSYVYLFSETTEWNKRLQKLAKSEDEYEQKEAGLHSKKIQLKVLKKLYYEYHV